MQSMAMLRVVQRRCCRHNGEYSRCPFLQLFPIITRRNICVSCLFHREGTSHQIRTGALPNLDKKIPRPRHRRRSSGDSHRSGDSNINQQEAPSRERGVTPARPHSSARSSAAGMTKGGGSGASSGPGGGGKKNMSSLMASLMVSPLSRPIPTESIGYLYSENGDVAGAGGAGAGARSPGAASLTTSVNSQTLVRSGSTPARERVKVNEHEAGLSKGDLLRRHAARNAFDDDEVEWDGVEWWVWRLRHAQRCRGRVFSLLLLSFLSTGHARPSTSTITADRNARAHGVLITPNFSRRDYRNHRCFFPGGA